MSEMVERVAKAMFETFMDWQFGQPLEWEGNPPPNAADLDREWRDREWIEQSEYHLRLARAATEAMREPTEAQLDAVTPDVSKDIADYERYAAGETYRAMIDAALKP